MVSSKLNTDNELSDTIHIAVAQWDFSDDYAIYSSATIVSVLENTTHNVIIHLFYNEELSKKNYKKFQENVDNYIKLCNKYNARIHFYDIQLPAWVLSNTSQKRLKKLTPGALLRLYIPNTLHNLNKVLYLDCDIIINTNLDNLWNTPIEDYYLAACKDPPAPKWFPRLEKKYSALNITLDKYFNSGVMLLNLDKIRESNTLPDMALGFLHGHNNPMCLDQDALNWLFQKGTYILNEKYNLFVRGSMTKKSCFKLKESNDFSDCILHYADSTKPWRYYCGHVDFVYWRYFTKTPWGESNILSYMQNALPVNYNKMIDNCFQLAVVTGQLKLLITKMSVSSYRYLINIFQSIFKIQKT